LNLNIGKYGVGVLFVFVGLLFGFGVLLFDVDLSSTSGCDFNLVALSSIFSINLKQIIGSK
tara:strand:+ start:267 stop:449 length:183 start_codon:yes stop_codon:yes gene_type:complete